MLQVLLVSCDQSAVTMRRCAGLSSSQLTCLSWSSTTGRATDCKYLFWAEFFLHGRKIMPKSDARGWSILTNSR